MLQVRSGQFESGQVKLIQVKSIMARSGQVRLGEVNSCMVRSGQVRSSQVMSGQIYTLPQSSISLTTLLRITKLVDIWLTFAFFPHLTDPRLRL